jgi:hypothetical protein
MQGLFHAPPALVNRIYIKGDRKIRYKDNPILSPPFSIIIANKLVPICRTPIFYKEGFNRRFQGVGNNYKSFQDALDMRSHNLGQIIHLLENAFLPCALEEKDRTLVAKSYYSLCIHW